MSSEAEFCSQNPLDDSIPFIAPEPYIITRAIIDQITSIVDRDIETEKRALDLYTVNTNKLNPILNALPDTVSNNTIMAQPNIKAAFANIKTYRGVYETLSNSAIKTYAKKNFIAVENRFSNKGTNFNIKQKYSESNKQLVLHDVEKIAINNYTNHGDVILNIFLREGGKSHITLKRNPILEAIQRCFKAQFPSNITNIYEKLYFTFFKVLYNTIVKIKMVYHNTDKYVRVFRGVNAQYLSEDPTKVFYINSFLSTSYDITVAEKFGHASPPINTETKDYNDYNINVFYVHPSCYYCNIQSVSNYTDEKELLITPYCRYVFIKKNIFWTRMFIKGGRPGRKYPVLYAKYYYAVFPTDLDIPANFDKFYEWIQNPLPPAPQIQDSVTAENVNINVVANVHLPNIRPAEIVVPPTKALNTVPEVGCIGASCGVRWPWSKKGGHTKRRKNKRKSTRKHNKA
jgi:hypothetical protein